MSRMLHPWRDTARRARFLSTFQCDPEDAWPIRREIDLLLLPIGFGDQKVIPRENGQLAKYQFHASTACPWLVSAITPSELPLALQPPPSETLFTKFVQKDIVAVRYLGTVFPAYVSERVQPIAVVMIGQKFNWKPSIEAALTDSPRRVEKPCAAN
jgi:hypothetical protein